MLAIECHRVVQWIDILLRFLDCSSALSCLSFLQAILLACHQEAVSAVEVAFVDAPLTDNLLRRLDLIALHVNDRCLNALALGGVILEFKSHLIATFAGSTSIYCIYFFVVDIIVLNILQIHFDVNGSLARAFFVRSLLLRRHALVSIVGMDVRLATALLLRTGVDELAHT